MSRLCLVTQDSMIAVYSVSLFINTITYQFQLFYWGLILFPYQFQFQYQFILSMSPYDVDKISNFFSNSHCYQYQYWYQLMNKAYQYQFNINHSKVLLNNFNINFNHFFDYQFFLYQYIVHLWTAYCLLEFNRGIKSWEMRKIPAELTAKFQHHYIQRPSYLSWTLRASGVLSPRQETHRALCFCAWTGYDL